MASAYSSTSASSIDARGCVPPSRRNWSRLVSFITVLTSFACRRHRARASDQTCNERPRRRQGATAAACPQTHSATQDMSSRPTTLRPIAFFPQDARSPFVHCGPYQALQRLHEEPPAVAEQPATEPLGRDLLFRYIPQ